MELGTPDQRPHIGFRIDQVSRPPHGCRLRTSDTRSKLPEAPTQIRTHEMLQNYWRTPSDWYLRREAREPSGSCLPCQTRPALAPYFTAGAVAHPAR